MPYAVLSKELLLLLTGATCKMTEDAVELVAQLDEAAPLPAAYTHPNMRGHSMGRAYALKSLLGGKARWWWPAHNLVVSSSVRRYEYTRVGHCCTGINHFQNRGHVQ